MNIYFTTAQIDAIIRDLNSEATQEFVKQFYASRPEWNVNPEDEEEEKEEA